MVLGCVETVNSHGDQLLAVNGRVSPNSPPVNGIAGLLGLGELMQCSETYSKKVFVGGLPPEVDEGKKKIAKSVERYWCFFLLDDIRIFFMRFGAVTVDWPHKSHCRGSIPPKGKAIYKIMKNSPGVGNRSKVQRIQSVTTCHW